MWQLHDGSDLARQDARQTHDLTIGKLERIMMRVAILEIELTERRDLHHGPPRFDAISLELDHIVERQLGAGP